MCRGMGGYKAIVIREEVINLKGSWGRHRWSRRGRQKDGNDVSTGLTYKSFKKIKILN